MSCLTEVQRRFVYAMIQAGVNPRAADQCAKIAGYEGNNAGYRCMRNERILAALHEESKKRLVGAALLGVNVMIEIASTVNHKDRYRAASQLAAINGFTAEQKITVTHVQQDQATIIQQIKERADRLGIDPRQLLLASGVDEKIIDAEFSDLPPIATETRPDVSDIDDSWMVA